MNTPIEHYLFGELRQLNTSRVMPHTKKNGLKNYLDEWLPQMIQRTEAAEPNLEELKNLCDQWSKGDHRDEVGVTSLPLPPNTKIDGVQYVQAVCRSYFSWASGGRVSNTRHAVLLTEEQWIGLDYNPFNLPHLVENAGKFETMEIDYERFALEFDEETNKIRSNNEAENNAHNNNLPIRLPKDAPLSDYEKSLMSLPPEVRATTSCVCGPFNLKQKYRPYVDVAQDLGEQIESSPIPIPAFQERKKEPTMTEESSPPTTPTKRGRLFKIGGAAITALALIISYQNYSEQSTTDGCDAWNDTMQDGFIRRGRTGEFLKAADGLIGSNNTSLSCESTRNTAKGMLVLVEDRLKDARTSSPRTNSDIESILRLYRDVSTLENLDNVLEASPNSIFSKNPDLLEEVPERLLNTITKWVKSGNSQERLAFVRQAAASVGTSLEEYPTLDMQ